MSAKTTRRRAIREGLTVRKIPDPCCLDPGHQSSPRAPKGFAGTWRSLCLIAALLSAALPTWAMSPDNPTAGYADAGFSSDLLIDTAHLENGESIAYILTLPKNTAPRFVLIVMPGGSGLVKAQPGSGQPSFQGKSNFLVRSRVLLSGDDIALATTDAELSVDRMRAIVGDLRARFPEAPIYIAGTSRSTNVTAYLTDRMDGEVAGFIHTSSMAAISDLDTRGRRSRHLIVTHRQDGCSVTPPSSSIANHERFGTELIVIEGGISEGNPCQPFGFHGFNGVEAEVADKIRAWIRKDTQTP